VAGAGYLAIIVTGIFAEFFVRGSLIVPGDAAATAGNIATSGTLYRTGIAAEFVMLACDVLLAALLYILFRKVDRTLAVLAAFFRVVHAAVVGTNLLNSWVPLLLLGDAPYLVAFTPDQRYALGLLLLDAHAVGYVIGLVFFGFHGLVLGQLVLRSGMVPRVLGILLMLAGAGYLVDGFARALMESYASYEGTFLAVVFLPAFVGELAFALWLLVKGVRPPAQAPGTPA